MTPGTGDTVHSHPAVAGLCSLQTDAFPLSQVTRIQMFHSPPTNVTRVTVAMERVSLVSGEALCMKAGLPTRSPSYSHFIS